MQTQVEVMMRQYHNVYVAFCPAILALVICLSVAKTAHAAETDWQQWTTFRLNLPVGKTPWSFGVWNQVRFDEDISHFNLYLFNPSVHYRLKDGLKLGIGYQYILKADSPDEQMPWQEVSIAHKFQNRFVWGNRLRLEERFIGDVGGVVFRLRYRMSGSYPLGDSAFYLTGSGAAWFNLNEQDTGPTSGFDQSRLFAGLGYHINGKYRMEFGYQWRYKDNGGGPAKSDNILLLQFFWDTKGKKKLEPIPAESHH